jgi:UDP-glucuronate decarboxylase
VRVLITGIAGWVGSHAARAAVARNWEVWGVVRSRSNLQRLQDIGQSIHLVHCNLDDWSQLATGFPDGKIDACLHCAWFAEPGKYLDAQENIASLINTLKLVQIVAAKGCDRFVGVGSCFEYSQQFGYLSETTPLEATSLYASAKIAASTAMQSLGVSLGVKTTWARLFFQYGPGEDARRLVPSVIRSLLAGEVVRTTKGEQIRDFLHIADVANALIEVTAENMGGAVNIGSGQPVSVCQVIGTLADQFGRRELVDLGALPYRPSDPMFICANNQRLVTETNWRPSFTLTSGLAHTIEWWKAHGL